MDISEAFIITAGTLCILYCLHFIGYVIKWESIHKAQQTIKTPITKVSVIVPARNESNNITKCLACIIKQEYPKNLFEIIVVDDCSDDNTIETATSEFDNYNFENGLVIDLKKDKKTGKKEAISKGVLSSKGELIITTDADCIMNRFWIQSFVNCYETFEPNIISGPVTLKSENTFFQKLQSLELCGLSLISGASIQNNLPLMANGANLCFEKKSFLEINGYKNNLSIPSGDDIFLVLGILKAQKKKAIYLKNPKAIVYTDANNSFSEFYQQRKRWASKSANLPSLYIKWIGFIVLALNLMLLLGFGMLLFSNEFNVIVFISIFGLKSIVDFFFLLTATSYFNKTKLMLLFPIGAIINILNVSLFGMVGFFGTYNWKGREY